MRGRRCAEASVAAGRCRAEGSAILDCRRAEAFSGAAPTDDCAARMIGSGAASPIGGPAAPAAQPARPTLAAASSATGRARRDH